jgi:hypothetical protein
VDIDSGGLLLLLFAATTTDAQARTAAHTVKLDAGQYTPAVRLFWAK